MYIDHTRRQKLSETVPPGPIGRRPAFLALVLALTLVLGGCGRTGERTVWQVIQEQSEKIQDYAVTVEITLYQAGSSQVQVARQWYRQPNSYRVEVVAPAEARGQLVVFDGRAYWFYNEREKVATYLEEAKARGLLPGEEFLADALLRQVLTGSGVQYLGTAELDGKPAYLFKLPGLGLGEGQEDDLPATESRPQAGANRSSFRRVWISRQWGLPLRMEGYAAPDKLIYTVSYTQLEVNQGLTAGFFSFQPPPGVQVIKGELGTELITLEEARRLASFPLLLPAYLPPGFRQTAVGRTGSGEGLTVVLFYEGEGGSLTLSERRLVGELTMPGARRVIYEGVPFFILEGTDFTLLSWSSQGVDLSLLGHLPLAEMIKIALSVR